MSFATDFYHVIRPKEAMLRRLAERPTDGEELLTAPQIWQDRGNTHDLTSVQDRAAYAKVMFMAQLHREYIVPAKPTNQDPFYDHLRHFLGDEPFTPSVFDQWWSIETIEDAYRMENVEEYVGLQSLRMVAAPGLDYVRKRLHRLMEQKEGDGKTANKTTNEP